MTVYPRVHAAVPPDGPAAGRLPVTVISYNLWENRAAIELNTLARTYVPDVVVVQEAFVDRLPVSIGHLHMVCSTTANDLGLCVYADTSRFELLNRGTFRLSPSRHDRWKGTVAERVAAVRLRDTWNGQDMIIGSVHAAPLTDSNRLRRRQIAEAHERVQSLGPDVAILLAGDYNYPFFARGLIRNLDRLGVLTARSASSTYRKRGFMRGVFDLATLRGFTIDRVDTLPQGLSDHHPILVTVTPDDEVS